MQISRRRFAINSFLAAGGLSSLSVLGAEPRTISGGKNLKVGLAAYSFREYFKDVVHDRKLSIAPEKRISLFQFIDYCAEHGVGAELTSYYFPQQLSQEFLLNLKRHAFLRGVDISGSAVGNTFTQADQADLKNQIQAVKKWVDNCAILGAPHLRVFAGTRRGLSHEEAKKQCIRALQECADYAGTKGVFLGIENHGGIVEQVPDLIEIVQAVKSDWLGINLDTGNFYSADPYKDMETCAPYAVNVQVKSELKVRNKADIIEADLSRVVAIMKRAKYQGYLTVEYEAAPDPFEAVPPLLKRMAAAIGSQT